MRTLILSALFVLSLAAQNEVISAGVPGSGSVSSSLLTDFAPTYVTGATSLPIGPGRFGAGNSLVPVTSTVTFNVDFVTVTAISSSGTTVTITASGSPNFLHVINGQSVAISGFTAPGCTNLNGNVYTATLVSATQIQVTEPATISSCTTVTGGRVGATGSASGLVYAEVAAQSVIFGHPQSIGMIAWAQGTYAIARQLADTSTFPGPSRAIATVNIIGASTGSTLTVAASNDVRTFFNALGIVGGNGINVVDGGGLSVINIGSNVMTMDGQNNMTGTFDGRSASRTAPCRAGNGAPTGQNGTKGDCYFQNDAAGNLYLWWASATGTPATWIQNVGTSSSGTMVQFMSNVPSATVTATTTPSAGTLLTGTMPPLPAGGCAVITFRGVNGASASLTHTLLIGSNSYTLATSAATNIVINNIHICNRPGSQTSQSIAWDISSVYGNATATENLAVATTVALRTQTASGTSAITIYLAHAEAPQ